MTEQKEIQVDWQPETVFSVQVTVNKQVTDPLVRLQKIMEVYLTSCNYGVTW
jgi:hypothetical protein